MVASYKGSSCTHSRCTRVEVQEVEPVLVKVHSHSDAISQLCWFPPLINTIIIIISKFIFAGLVMGRWRRRKAP